MSGIYIDLKNGQLVKAFVDAISGLRGSFKIKADRVLLDAKSIMGIYTLDLSKPVLLVIEPDAEDDLDLLKEFIL